MSHKAIPILWTVLFILACLFSADTVSATQTHGEMEGLYSHLIAHVIFLVAMVYFCLKLFQSGMHRRRGWGWITLSALFFSLWNVTTIFVHSYKEVLPAGAFIRNDLGLVSVFQASSFLDLLYYIGRLDHLLSFPALLFLFFGLRAMVRRPEGVP